MQKGRLTTLPGRSAAIASSGVPPMTIRMWLSLTALLLLSPCAFAEEKPMPITTLKPLHIETSLGAPGAPAASIVTGESCRDIAFALQRRIEEITRITLPVVRDTVAAKVPLLSRNAIVLGHYGTNRLLERLYYQWHVVVDASQPGAGGFLLQTLHNPHGTGANVVVLGGSDPADVERAADRLLDHIARNGPALPRIFEVEMGVGADLVLARGSEVLDPNREWPTIHPMEVQQTLAEAAMLYLYTGDEAFARAFKDHLVPWLEKGDFQAVTDDFARTMISWDLIEEAPVFTDDERLWITNRLLDALRFEHSDKSINYRAFVQVRDQWILRENHRARWATSFFFGARYFRDYYRLPEADVWLDDVRTYYKPQMISFVPMEGVDNMAHITLTEALNYALADDVSSFLSPQVLGRIADKAMMKTLSGRYVGYSRRTTPMLFWCLAAHRFDNGEYLRPVLGAAPDMRAVRLPWKVSWAIGRSFWDGRLPSPQAPAADWVASAPLSDLYYRTAMCYGPKNVPLDETFDFLVIKDPEDAGSQYLLLGGHNTGSYSADSANSILSFMARGRSWLYGGGRVQTSRKHTSVSIVRDGRCDPLPAFARLIRAEETDGCAFTRSALLDHDGTDWYRNIINLPDRWFLVVDEITAREAGDFCIENRWVHYVNAGFDGDDWVMLQSDPTDGKPLQLRLTGLGWKNQYVIPWVMSDYLASPPHRFPRRVEDPSAEEKIPYVSHLSRRWTGRLGKGQTHVFANLLYVQSAGDAPLYSLGKVDDTMYRVTGSDRSWTVRADDRGRWRVEESTMSDVAPGTLAPARPREGPPTDLDPLWTRTESSRILSAARSTDSDPARFALGLADGRIRTFDARGRDVADASMPGKVFAVTWADLDGDGADELIAGSDTGGVRAFSSEGAELWTWTPPPPVRGSGWRQSFGTMRPVITEVIPLDVNADGKPEILAGGLYFYILDRQGKLLTMYDIEEEEKVSDSVGKLGGGLSRTFENTLILAAGDLDGDGKPEIVGDIARIYNFRAWDARTAKRLAVFSRPNDRYLGNWIKAVATGDVDGDGKDEFAIASDAFLQQLALYAFPDGMTWSRNVGAAANVIAMADLTGNGDADIIVGTGMGQVQAFDGQGNRLFLTDVHESVTSLAVASHEPNPRIWVGTVNGRLFVLGNTGAIIHRGRLPGYLDRILVAPDGPALVVSSDGPAALFARQ